MNWYKKARLNIPEITSKLNITYNDILKDDGQIIGHLFTDNITRSTFFVSNGENIADILNRIRSKFIKKEISP